MPYTYSLLPPSPSWLSIATVNSQGIVTANKALVPATGYQGIIRVQATDGTNTKVIDRPINIAARVDSQGRSLFTRDAVLATTIEFGLKVGIEVIVEVFAAPAIIPIAGLIAGIELLDAAVISGGGGADDMVMDYQTTGALLSTKPTAAGAADAVINAVRKQRFYDTGFGLDTSINANGDILECTIERNAIWQSRVYFNVFTSTQEWLLASAGTINVNIEKVNSSVVAYMWGGNPTQIGIVPDAENQQLIITHFNLASNNVKAGYSRWVAHHTDFNTGLATGTAGKYWDWQPANNSNWSN